jgi:hypothetical protein
VRVRFRLAGIIVLLWLALRPVPAAAASPAPSTRLDWAIPDGHFYTQANGFPLGTSPMGFAIVDDTHARFWTAFQKHGGVDRLGYPISRRFVWDGFITQVTQKAVLQWRPEKEDIDFVNIFDELSKSGHDAWLLSVRSVPRPLPPSFDSGLSWQQIVAHRVALLRARPALYARYTATKDPLDLYGLPTSPVLDVGPMYVIRLQRAVLQEWKVNRPWARVGDVTVANGGDVGKEAGIFPWKQLRPIAPPSGTWTAKAGTYVLTGHATWYGPGFVGKAMADGQIYHPEDPSTTASNAFPLGSIVRVSSPKTGRTVTLQVRDTGRFPYPDVLDLSPAAFQSLGGALGDGVIPVTVTLLDVGSSALTSNTHAPPPS